MNLFNPQFFSGTSLTVFSGIVENFSETIQIRKDGNPHDEALKEAKSTSYLASFQIREKQIQAEFPKSVMIKNGDQISVCGEEKNGRLHVLTFKNYTQNLSQNSSIWWLNILLGVAFLILTVYFYFYFLTSPMLVEQLVATVFTITGCYLIYYGLLIQKAIAMLEELT